MKAKQFITHPITLIICFCMVLISGEHIGGFYFLYILIGLKNGAIHSFLGIGGASILLLNAYIYKMKSNYLIKPVLNITGVMILLISLLIFFINDEHRYNYLTFNQTVPVLSLIIFSIVALSFSLNNLNTLFRRDTQ